VKHKIGELISFIEHWQKLTAPVKVTNNQLIKTVHRLFPLSPANYLSPLLDTRTSVYFIAIVARRSSDVVEIYSIKSSVEQRSSGQRENHGFRLE